MVKLDLQRVNAEAPYKVMPTVREGYFRFTTDFGVDYIIGFSQEELLDYEETYQFAIINANHQKSPRDRKPTASCATRWWPLSTSSLPSPTG